MIHGKLQDLQQALVNILINAVQAMPDGGVNPHLGPAMDSDGDLRIDLSDTGKGIAPEALERIFDPFYTTKTAGQGTGLGSVHCIQHYTKPWRDHRRPQRHAGQGTTFSIFLPTHNCKGKR